MKTLELNQEELYKLMISLCPHTELDGYRELQNKIRKAMGFPVGFEYDQSYDNVARLMMEAIFFTYEERPMPKEQSKLQITIKYEREYV